MSLQPGTIVGDYEVLQVLGAGGMGAVYKVRNTISDRVEAMKVLLPNLEGNSELADRFIREIKVQASLHHPNIASLHTALRSGNQLLMIMEFVEGESLESLLLQGPIPVGRGIESMCQVLSALSYAHSRGVIHRDLKPGNIMLTPQGTVKLMDFGIARLKADRRLTQTGHTVGSLFYMSPEQIQGAANLDARSDLYSLGICLYEIFTGRRPFHGDSDYSIMSAHLQSKPVAPIELDPKLPPVLSEIILMSIAKDAAQRFQSADAMRTALESVQRTLEGGIAPVPPSASTAAAGSPPAGSRSARRLAYMTAGSLATIAILVLAVTQIPQWRKTEAVPLPPAQVQSAPPPKAAPPAPEPEPAPESDPGPATPLPAASRPEPIAQREERIEKKPATSLPVASRPEPPAEPAAGAPAPVALPVATTPPPAPSSPPARAQEPPPPPAEPAVVANPTAAPEPAPPPSLRNPVRTRALSELRERMLLMATRIGAVKSGLAQIRRAQERSGLGLRGDITASEKRMELRMDQAEAAIGSGDPEAGTRHLDGAEKDLEKLERFLGR